MVDRKLDVHSNSLALIINLRIILIMLEKNKFLLIFLLFLFYINADSVCDHEVFILELKQDLEDNGILDCLR